MRRLRITVLATVAAVAALAQTASEKPNDDVRRVGSHLACKCGCKDSIATCSMLECEYSKPGKLKIARMQAVGMNDDQIIQSFIQEFGADIYLAPPSAFGWVVPYAMAGLGLGAIYLFLRRYYRPRPKLATPAGSLEIDDPALAKYKDQIDKEMADLE